MLKYAVAQTKSSDGKDTFPVSNETKTDETNSKYPLGLLIAVLGLTIVSIHLAAKIDTLTDRVFQLEGRVAHFTTQEVINQSIGGSTQSRIDSLERMAEVRYQTTRALQEDLHRLRMDVVRSGTHVTIPTYDTPPRN